MLYKSRGIALSYIKYKESSIIARIFTEAFGMQ
ncbi:MAG: recombination protein O N-terminal domain-containing protein, partial [Cyclobacteriaceae bacterium]|nr:recombination protein O N-terminal domain-containing protein [Cyclobacteriaceae bacterium]